MAVSRRYPVGIASVRFVAKAGINAARAGLAATGGAGFGAMVDVSDIRDQESLEAWLEDQPREVAVWIASRAAARVMPVWWDAVLTEDWARERDLTALPVSRSVLISSVAARVPTNDTKAIGAALVAAHAASNQAATHLTQGTHVAAITVAWAAAYAANAALHPSHDNSYAHAAAT